MNNDRFYERIDKLDNIDKLTKRVCELYQLGDYKNTKLVEIGYEDFNAIITTQSGKYFMKIYNNSRSDEEVMNVVERANISEKYNVKSPKVFKNYEGQIITNIKYNNFKFRLSIMEYINGKNFLELGENATEEELLKIADLASQFGNVDYKPNFVYDTWAISSFIEEFDKKKKYISEENIKLIKPIYDNFKKFNYDLLPKSFTHGDVILTNVIKDERGEYWIVDYSVSNYNVRLNEIVVSSSDFGIVNNQKYESEKRIKLMFERWASKVNATEQERKSFEILFRVENAIYILNPSYEIAMGNNSGENKMYLELGKFGLTLDVDMNE